jgi:hypothetical protein
MSQWVVFLVGSTALIGCGGGGAASVSGKVTYKNEPVKGGSLTFIPVGDKGTAEAGKPAAADVDAEGRYRVSASTGKHRVNYSPPSVDPGRELKPGEAPPPSPYKGLTPVQPEIEIKSGGSTLDIELVKPAGK